jgi:hypothetical protein
MSKIDKKDAYKLVPAPIEDLRLQGFSLLGKYFVETQQIFGSQKAVKNFDRLANTVNSIVSASSSQAWRLEWFLASSMM